MIDPQFQSMNGLEDPRWYIEYDSPEGPEVSLLGAYAPSEMFNDEFKWKGRIVPDGWCEYLILPLLQKTVLLLRLGVYCWVEEEGFR